MRGFCDTSPNASPEEEEFFEILNPCTDWAFKNSLRDDRDACCKVVNALLELEGDEAFTEVFFMETGLSSTHPLGSRFTLDLLAKDGNDRYCLIEMQNELYDYYLDLMRAKHGRLEGNIDCLNARDSDLPVKPDLRTSVTKHVLKDLKGIYSLVISNQNTRPPQPEIINTYEYRHIKHLDKALGRTPSRITFVTLAQFEKEAEDLKTDLDRFLYFFKDSRLKAHKKKIPMYKLVSNQTKVMGKKGSAVYRLYNFLKVSHLGADLVNKIALEHREAELQLEKRDKENYTKGRAEGRAEGREELYQKALRMVKLSELGVEQVIDLMDLDTNLAQRLRAVHTDKEKESKAA